MKRYLAQVIKDNEEYIVTIAGQNKKTVNNGLEAYGYKVVKLIEEKKAHVCKYCGNIVEGTEEDILCEDCREYFGHAFFSEL